MPRLRRILITDQPAVYHVISRSALPGLPISDPDKGFFFNILKFLTSVYCLDLIGFCIMGDHFHLLVQTYPQEKMSDADVGRSFKIYYGDNSDKVLPANQISNFRQKWTHLSQYVKELKQRFTHYYNKHYGRKGYFWTDRYKSVIVEKGWTLLNCLAYIDLNPVRAGLVQKPEDYPWSSMGYLARTGNKDGLLTLDFGLEEYNIDDVAEQFRMYREYVYKHGGLEKPEEYFSVDKKKAGKGQKKGTKLTTADRLLSRTRYLTEGVFVGSPGFVKEQFQRFKDELGVKRDRKPHKISGFENIYSFRQTP